MRRSIILPGSFGAVAVAVSILAACSSQDTPHVSTPPATGWEDRSSPHSTKLRDDDIVVIRAAIVGLLTSDYGVPYNMTHGGVRMVMPDRTIRVCPLPENRPGYYGCILTTDHEALNGLLAADYGPGAVRLFHDRNAQSSVIRRQISPQFQLVQGADLLDMLEGPWSKAFAQRFPDRQGVLTVSAPIYPTAGRSVVYVLHVVHSAAYVDLERQRGTWKVRAVRGLWIS